MRNIHQRVGSNRILEYDYCTQAISLVYRTFPTFCLIHLVQYPTLAPYLLTSPCITYSLPKPFTKETIPLFLLSAVVESNELSQTAMDVITIVWYVATFLALAAFFMLMACSDRRCRDMRGRQAGSGSSSEVQRAPPTPSPSYSEFAPPSYDTVIKMQHAAKTSIFVIPFEGEANKANNNNNNNTDESITSAVSVLPASVYTIDERPKLDK